ncbi:MAG: hypothetical protein RR620_03250 [Clostridium sp.]
MKAKEIALGGILTSISLIILYSSSIIPVSTLSILTVVSCIVPIAIINSSIKVGAVVYGATSLLGFLLVPTNLIITYILFFGIYGIFKHFIERMNSLPKEVVVKLIFFNISFATSYFVLKLLLGNVEILISPILLIIAAQVVFLVYDYALTLIISFYLNRIKPSI